MKIVILDGYTENPGDLSWGELEALGELNGKRIREDLVQTIFSRFCVGK